MYVIDYDSWFEVGKFEVRVNVEKLNSTINSLEELVNQGEANRMGFTSYGVSMTTLEEVK